MASETHRPGEARPNETELLKQLWTTVGAEVWTDDGWFVLDANEPKIAQHVVDTHNEDVEIGIPSEEEEEDAKRLKEFLASIPESTLLIRGIYLVAQRLVQLVKLEAPALIIKRELDLLDQRLTKVRILVAEQAGNPITPN